MGDYIDNKMNENRILFYCRFLLFCVDKYFSETISLTYGSNLFFLLLSLVAVGIFFFFCTHCWVLYSVFSFLGNAMSQIMGHICQVEICLFTVARQVLGMMFTVVAVLDIPFFFVMALFRKKINHISYFPSSHFSSLRWLVIWQPSPDKEGWVHCGRCVGTKWTRVHV